MSRAGDPDREIERKFLLRDMPRLPAGARVLRIDQGWLPGQRLRERLRRTREGAATTYYRTVKLGSGLERLEIEEETTEAVFRTLWRLTRGKRVRKVRYVVDGRWEIDRFVGCRLVLAELELEHAEERVQVPEWLAPYIDREVTGDGRYTNYHLAR
ncbi:MAG: adenylate cyclase [Gemmatimonadetes bacterium]|nr:adenylate cyclase [Gemmatimonadota bacterium]